jgi:hypothetical protein
VAVGVHGVEQMMMPKRGPAFIHDLGLALWVKVLGDFAHNPNHLALPRFQQWGMLFNKIEEVFLRLFGKPLGLEFSMGFSCLGRQGAPHVIDLLLRIGLAVFAFGKLLGQ